ncbi:hypothetical protein K1X84_03105 [bacterium]|nr:hypothetical protein [bacterium]
MSKVISIIFLYTTLIASALLHSQDSTTVFASTAIKDIRAYLEKSRQDLVTLNQAKRLMLLQYETMILTIGDLKEKEDLGWFGKIQLKNLLKESEDLSQQFVKLDKLILAHRETNHVKIESMTNLMSEEIEALIGRITKTKYSAGVLREMMTDTLQAMIHEKSAMQLMEAEPIDIVIQNVKISRNDDAELMSQKADFLMDQHDKFLHYAKTMEQKIRQLDTDIRLNRKIKIISNEMSAYAATRDSKILFREFHTDIVLSKLNADNQDSLNLPFVEVHNTLPLSNIRVAPTDAPYVVLQKFQYEWSLALAQANRYESTAKEAYWLADFKKKH